MTRTKIWRFGEIVRIVESSPQSLVNVESLDKVVIVEVSRVADHEIKIFVNLRMNEERNKFVRKWIEVDNRRTWIPLADFGSGLSWRRKVDVTVTGISDRYVYCSRVSSNVWLCFRCGGPNWSV